LLTRDSSERAGAIVDFHLDEAERKDSLPPDPPFEARCRHRLRACVIVFSLAPQLPSRPHHAFYLPIVTSLLLVRYGDLEAYKSSRASAYLRRHMTRTVEGVRFAGDIVMAIDAWFHHPSLIALGVAVIIFAWCSGLFRNPPLN
jgi:hypothetical protein